MSILVAIPVYNRPHRAAAIVDSHKHARSEVETELLFLCSPGDTDEIEAVKATGAPYKIVPWPQGPGDYACKINHALTVSEHEWIFTGADDLHFHPRWAEHALAASHTHAVRGTNDLGNPVVQRGLHSTHSLVRRDYALEHGTIDQPGLIYHEGYHHNWCDAEMIDTAKARKEFVFARRSIVEHLHPHWKKAEMDSTYDTGLADFNLDRRLYGQRKRLWSPRRGRQTRSTLL